GSIANRRTSLGNSMMIVWRSFVATWMGLPLSANLTRISAMVDFVLIYRQRGWDCANVAPVALGGEALLEGGTGPMSIGRAGAWEDVLDEVDGELRVAVSG